MPDPGGADRPLIFAYDNGPANGPPISPRPDQARRPRPRWPGLPRLPRWPGWPRLRLKRPHPFRRLADFLILLAAAAPEQIASRPERFRYITVGLLMLVTAAQAFYAATLFMSVSLGKPFVSEIGYGVFFATAVYLIDRSIISFAAPIKLDQKKEHLAPPKKTSWVVAIRVGIAIAAAMLMSEMILLQVFAGDINEQIQTDHIAASSAATQQIEANFQARITPLQNQINAARNVVDQDQQEVNSDYKAMNCQEFGCPGITGGIGPGYAAATVNWQNAVTQLKNAQGQLQAVRGPDLAQIKVLDGEEQQAANAAQPAISHADKVLSQEEAFWQLTVKNGTVLVVRLLLSLLILGIDLAPILTKLTGRTSMYDILAYSSDYRAREKDKHEAKTAIHRFATQGEMDRQVRDIQLDSALFRARQEADVARTRVQRQADVARATADANAEAELYRIDLEARLKKSRHYRDFMTWQSGRANGPGGNGGNPGGPAGPGGYRAGPGSRGAGARVGRPSDAGPAADQAEDSVHEFRFVAAPVAPAGERHACRGGDQQAAGPAPSPDPEPVSLPLAG